MKAYETYFGIIDRKRQVTVFTNHGAVDGLSQPLEQWLEKTGMELVSILQPDPVRVPHKVNIVVRKPSNVLANIDFGPIEDRTMALYAAYGKTYGAFSDRKSPTGREKRRTVPATEQLFTVRVTNQGYIKLETKPYTRERAEALRADLETAFPGYSVFIKMLTPC